MRPIEGHGTDEAHWRGWIEGLSLPSAVLPTVQRLPGLSGPGRTLRAVVLAAHPDDEVLGAGGTLHLLARQGWQVDVVWASDGEASHPGSTVMSPAELAARRRRESLGARSVLGLTGATTWLGLPDSDLRSQHGRIRYALEGLAHGADLLLAPWREDGHPDHEVCGQVAADVAEELRTPLWELPVWAWHWGRGEELGPRWPHAAAVRLDEEAVRAKASAVAQFTTQTQPLGPAPEDAPVLPEHVLARFRRDVEVVLTTQPAERAAVS